MIRDMRNSTIVVVGMVAVGALAMALWGAYAGTDQSPAGMRMRDDRSVGVNDLISVVYFFDRDCPQCEEIGEQLLPEFLRMHGLDESAVDRIDVTTDTAFGRLLAYEEALNFKAKSLAPVLIVGERVFCDVESFRVFVHGNADSE